MQNDRRDTGLVVLRKSKGNTGAQRGILGQRAKNQHKGNATEILDIILAG